MGLRENWVQVALLLAAVVFLGAVVGSAWSGPCSRCSPGPSSASRRRRLRSAFWSPSASPKQGRLFSPAISQSAIGRYRLWRDLGYAVGALFAGLLTDLLDFRATIVIIALLLVGSAAVARVLLPRPTRA
jgi:hypothetical protein